MSSRTLMTAALGFALVSCGVKSPQKASRTLAGLSQQQVLIAAQHTLADDGIDTEEIDFENGVLKSTWQEKNQRQIQYEVAIMPKGMAPDSSGNAAPPQSDVETLVVVVSASAKDKLVGGWSEPTPTSMASVDNMLDDIISTAISRFGSNTVVATSSESKCSGSQDCPNGMHCSSGKCAAECVSSSDCETGKQCDERGRCIPPKPEPCPEVPACPEPPVDEPSKKRKRRSSHGEH